MRYCTSVGYGNQRSVAAPTISTPVAGATSANAKANVREAARAWGVVYVRDALLLALLFRLRKSSHYGRRDEGYQLHMEGFNNQSAMYRS